MKNYKKEIDQSYWTQEGKENLIRRIDMNSQEEHARKTRQFKRVVVAVLAITLFCAGTVIGKGNMNTPSEIFGNMFGKEKKQTEILDEIGYVPDVQVVSNGIKMNVKAIIGDGRHIAIMYELSKEDGSSLELEFPIDNTCQVEFDDVGGNKIPLKTLGLKGYGITYSVVDLEPKDQKIQIMEMISCDEQMPRNIKVTSVFENIIIKNNPKDYPKQVEFQGKWELEFNLQYEDCSVKVPAGQKFKKDDFSFCVEEIELSPIGMHLVISEMGDGIYEYDMEGKKYLYRDMPVCLNMKNGTVINLRENDESYGGSGEESGNRIQKVQEEFMFKTLRPLEDIKSITVGEVEILLPEK